MAILKKRVPQGALVPNRPAAPVTKPLQAKDPEKILELINRRQRQIIVHSVIYYRMNSNLLPDKTWDIWARELVALQKDHPDIAAESVFWEDMKDFDGTTGFHLADHVWGLKIAPSLMRVHTNIAGGK